MKRQSLILKNTRRHIHIVAALIGLVLAYIVASVVSWSIFNVRSQSLRQDAITVLSAQRQTPAESLTDRRSLQEDVTATLDRSCQPSRLVAWQTEFIPALQRNVTECVGSNEAPREALATYRQITDYLDGQAFMTETIAAANAKSGELPARDAARHYELWNEAAMTVASREVSQDLIQLQDHLAVNVRGVADAWKATKESDSYDGVPSAYDALAGTRLRITSTLPDLQKRFSEQVETLS